MRIGVDVGGTNTDAVIMDGDRLLGTAKTQTTVPVNIGIVLSIRAALKDASIAASKIRAAMVGTTQITNALAERRDLAPTAIIRLCLPANRAVRPMMDWPPDVATAIDDHVYWTSGGAEFSGEVFSPLDEDDIRRIGHDVNNKNIRHVAIIGLFSPVQDQMEERAAEIIREVCPRAGVTLSKNLGGLGFIERENVAILNAALGDVALRIIAEFSKAIKIANISAPIFVSQNDGILMTASYARQYPIFMAKSGPTNSILGAHHLSGLKDAIVVDIGGATTDVGALFKGAPREKSLNNDLCEIRTNFRMPDIMSIPLGGGSIVKIDPTLRIGPRSIARDLEKHGVVFGGDILTTTDIAVAAGRVRLGDRKRLRHLSEDGIKKADRRIHETIDKAIAQMNLTTKPAKVIIVGGGQCLIGPVLKNTRSILLPKHGEVANAVGAAVARIGGEVSISVSYLKASRRKAINKATTLARKRAVKAGADPKTIKTLAIDETSLAHRSGERVRLRVKVAGKIMLR
jgi:N-methylhydantoinase A/oxoprolinase/acetone carboxylase beta subunit